MQKQTIKLVAVVFCVLLVNFPVFSGGQTSKPTEPAGASFLDVGKQEPITVLINESPWYGGFEKLVELYEQQTGNAVYLDVTPWAGMLEKARNAVRDAESPLDILNIDQFVITELYSGGFLSPLTDIDPSFKFPKEALLMNETLFWNERTNWRDKNGKIMSFSPNGNTLSLYYREDLYQQAGLKPPKSWDDVITACKKLHDPPNLYGVALGSERGGRIAVDFSNMMGGFGAAILKDPANGDFSVVINSPEAKKALDLYIDLLRNYGPPEFGSLGQGALIQYMLTGKVVHIVSATAAWSNMDNPEKSEVVDKVNVAALPNPTNSDQCGFLGSWCMAIPQNIPMERKKAALAFAKWFLTYEAQYKFAEFGAIPVRSDIYESDLASQRRFRWFEAYKEQIPTAVAYMGYPEGSQVSDVLGLRLNQAIIGELSSAEALNRAAEEIHAIFVKSGKKTGMLKPLVE